MAKTQADSNSDDPEEMFAWMFAAGIPDPRQQEGRIYPHQPLVPPNCFPALSRMLYDMGARFHPELQTKWVNPRSGPARNFEAWGLTDIEPIAAEMLAQEFPEQARRLASLSPERAKTEVKDTAARLMKNLEEMRALQDQLKDTLGGDGGGTS